MFPGQGQVARGGRTNFLDGHPEAEPLGRGQGGGRGGAGPVGSPHAIGQDLAESLT